MSLKGKSNKEDNFKLLLVLWETVHANTKLYYTRLKGRIDIQYHDLKKKPFIILFSYHFFVLILYHAAQTPY